MNKQNSEKYDAVRECIDRSCLRGDGMPSLRVIEKETRIPKSTVSRILSYMKEQERYPMMQGVP